MPFSHCFFLLAVSFASAVSPVSSFFALLAPEALLALLALRTLFWTMFRTAWKTLRRLSHGWPCSLHPLHQHSRGPLPRGYAAVLPTGLETCALLPTLAVKTSYLLCLLGSIKLTQSYGFKDCLLCPGLKTLFIVVHCVLYDWQNYPDSWFLCLFLFY